MENISFKISLESYKSRMPLIFPSLIDGKVNYVLSTSLENRKNGNYGGIVSEYLHEFSEFSGVYFKITKYRNINRLVNAVNNDKIDIYFSYGDIIKSNYTSTNNGINNTLSIVTNKNSDKMINSIYGLQNEEVYVEENSNIHNYLKKIDNIKIKTYKNNNELFKLNKKNVIIVMDSYVFNYYSNTKLNNYVSKYNSFINSKYTFKVNKENKTLLSYK